MSQVDRESGFTHFDGAGNARMVDVSGKSETKRVALAAGSINMSPQAYALVVDELIPLAHPLMITRTNIDFIFHDEDCSIEIQATVGICGKTGVEMEALTAVSLAALTVYDMCKAVDKSMVISNIRLLKKSGGKSGIFVR